MLVLLYELSSCAAGNATDVMRVSSIQRFVRRDEIHEVLLLVITHFIRVVRVGVALHVSNPM